jgi:hypothetical protein
LYCALCVLACDRKDLFAPGASGEAQRCGAATEGIPYRGLRPPYVLADLADKEILMFRPGFRRD